jgi:hypothetical protein
MFLRVQSGKNCERMGFAIEKGSCIMKRGWQRAATVLAGILITAMYAMPQGYTVSARPGALNYIEGNVFINGQQVSDKGLRSVFLNANDTLTTDLGKAEVLLTPGVFLRVGENAAVKMISPSLTDTQVEVSRGEAIIEVDGLVKENDITVLDHEGTIKIQKEGLYRFSADNPPTAAVLEGKAEVLFGREKLELSKGHETVIGPTLKAQKFDRKQVDDLYAWSNIRSQYDAASSYQAAKNVSLNNSGGWWGYGFNGWYSPGWFWNNGFDSWAWLPAFGAFYSPFGWGFYAPGIIGYAPVVYVPVYGGGGVVPVKNPQKPGKPGTPVAVNPKNPPAVGALASSPASYAQARAQAAHSFASTGYATASGGHVSASYAAASFGGPSGGGAAHVSSGGGASSGGGGHASGGGFSGAASAGGGGHAGGGGGGGGGGHR